MNAEAQPDLARRLSAPPECHSATRPGWLACRDSALGLLDERGLPDNTHEEWRYTSLSDYVQRGPHIWLRRAPQRIRPDASQISDGTTGQPQLVLRDGSWNARPGEPHCRPAIEAHSLRDLSPELRTRADRTAGQGQCAGNAATGGTESRPAG